jgi:excisionase family DNA binding protein
MARVSSSPNFADYLTVGEAAEFLGVSRSTLRNWDRSGKLKPRRHPQNGYRIYLHEDLQAILPSADASTGDTSLAPQVDWSGISDAEHFVQFYESDDFLIESIGGFVRAALATGNASVVIATLEHRLALQRRLVTCGVDVAAAIEAGRYVVLDAADTLSKLMLDGAPDRQRFLEIVSTVIAQLAEGGRRVHAFGEMVALLWGGGKRDAAIRLEELWNELGTRHRFALCCGYPISGFSDADDDLPFNGVCDCHSRVIPAESYAAMDNVDQRMRAIGLLQQKAQALKAEIAHRREVERALSQQEREIADPLETAAEGRREADKDRPIPRKLPKQRILVVDDNRDACHTLSLLLKLHGHDVRTAHNGLEALEAVAEFQPRVILMDVSMPKLNGYEATRRIRQMPAGKHAYIVALTGWAQTTDRQLSMEAGCSAHLVKPVEFAALERLLERGLAGS